LSLDERIGCQKNPQRLGELSFVPYLAHPKPAEVLTMHSALMLLPLLTACVGDVGEGKVAAKVNAPSARSADMPSGAEQWKVDTSRSKIRALGAKVTATHPIDFHTWQGSLSLDEGKLVGMDFKIDVDSLESDHPKLTSHLKNEDFLWVEKHPEATFVSTKVAPGSGDDGLTHTITGDLSIRGKALSITFGAKVDIASKEAKASAEFTINRQDFDVRYPGRPDNLVQDNVVLTIDLVASPGEATQG